eukprot:scaffold95244_cov26-Tisochrysis_lutea.AAC.1
MFCTIAAVCIGKVVGKKCLLRCSFLRNVHLRTLSVHTTACTNASASVSESSEESCPSTLNMDSSNIEGGAPSRIRVCTALMLACR